MRKFNYMMGKTLLKTLCIALCLFSSAATFTLQWAKKNTGFWVPGEDVVIPLLITPETVGEALPYAGQGASKTYSFRLSGSAPNWLKVSQVELCTTPECLNGSSWQEKQSYWVEIVGTPPIPTVKTTYSGTLTVTNSISRQVKTISFNFDVYPADGSFALLFNDPAANFAGQIEMRTSIVTPDGVAKILHSPYYDYYFNSSRIPTISMWYSPYPNTCFQVAKCSDGSFRLRTRINQDILVSTTRRDIQMGYWETFLSLPEKIHGAYNDIDKSYLYPMNGSSPDFAQRAYSRNKFYNGAMVLYDGDGSLKWGSKINDALICNSVVKNKDFLTRTPDLLCPSNLVPSFHNAQNEEDTIFQGEDYIFLPKVNDLDGDLVTLKLMNAPSWIEIGTPADGLPDDYIWPHKSNSMSFVRSKYERIREQRGLVPQRYSYQLQALDGKGGVATLNRSILVKPADTYPQASSHRIGVLAGDETWFLKYQLDVSIGLLNLTNHPITLVSPWVDYYIDLVNETIRDWKPWYIGNATSTFVDCGNGHRRLRVSSMWNQTIPASGSVWDYKIGIVGAAISTMDKADDFSYGEGDFINPITSKWVNASRKINYKVALFSNGGDWEWGDVPDWAGDCPDPALPREVVSDTGWVARFFDVDTTTSAVEPHIRLDYTNYANKDVGGTIVRTYFSILGPHHQPYLTSPADNGTYRVTLNQCGIYNNQYAIDYRIKPGVKLDGYGRLLEDLRARVRTSLRSRTLNGQVEIANLFEDLPYQNSHKFVQSDNIVVMDHDSVVVVGNEVYQNCVPMVSSVDTSDNMGEWSQVEILFQDGVSPEYLKQTNIQFTLRNNGDTRFVLEPGDYIRYYFIYNVEDVLDGPTFYDSMTTEVYWGTPIIQIDSCKGNLKSIKYTTSKLRSIAAHSTYAGGGLFSNLDLRVANQTWPRYNKENDYSYLATNSKTSNHRMVIFRANGEPISGILPEDEEGPVLCPGDKLESGVGYIPCMMTWNPVQTGGAILVSDTSDLSWDKSLTIQAIPLVGYRFSGWITQNGSPFLVDASDISTSITNTCGIRLNARFEPVQEIQTTTPLWDTTWDCLDNSRSFPGLEFVGLWSDGDSLDMVLASKDLGVNEYSIYLDATAAGDSAKGYEKRIRVRPGFETSIDTLVGSRWATSVSSLMEQSSNDETVSIAGYGIYAPGTLAEFRVRIRWTDSLRWWVDGVDQDVGSAASPKILYATSSSSVWKNKINGQTCDWIWDCFESSSSATSSNSNGQYSSSSIPTPLSSSTQTSSSSITTIAVNNFVQASGNSFVFTADVDPTWMYGRSAYIQVDGTEILTGIQIFVNGQEKTLPNACSTSTQCQALIYSIPNNAPTFSVEVRLPTSRNFTVRWWVS